MVDRRGWHHGYLALVMMAVALLLSIFTMANGWFCAGLYTFGNWVLVDDLYQHLRQRKEPEYRSPLHRFYGRTIWQWRWVQALNAWADRIFGKDK